MKKIKTDLRKCVQKNSLLGIQEILHSYTNVTAASILCSCINEKSGETLLHIAAKCNCLTIMKYLITEGCSVNHTDFDGKTALHCACQFEHFECANYLITAGADVNKLKNADWTPLMLACAKGNYDIAKLLVNNNADTSLQNKDGWTAFHIACRCGSENVVNYLLNIDYGQCLTVSKNGRTPLHTAALNGCTDVCSLLLRRHAYKCMDECDSCGSTPLMDALRAGHVDIAHLLLFNVIPPASLDRVDNTGRHSIHICSESGQVDSLKFLINHQRIDVNLPARGKSLGLTAIHLAAKEGHLKALELLVNLGALNINSTDCRGRTALDLASYSRRESCVKALLNAGGQHGVR